MSAPAALAQSPLLVRRERLLPLLLVSAAVHAALIAAAALYRPAPQVDLAQKPVMVRLARLGEKRPAQWLPRKDEAAPSPAATAPQPAPPAATPPKPPPAVASVPVTRPTRPAPAPSARATGPAAPGRSDVLASVMDRVRRDQARQEKVYGDPNGDARGDAESSEGDPYLGLVERALRDSYVLPSTLSESDRVRLQATIVLYLDADGRVLRYEFERRSGNDAFDAALERAVRAARIPPPPSDRRRQYREKGLGVLYKP
ncbi:MAG TPA: energy transducer TonB [Anaeromyxobacteraceae bacterium]|nr:energy transducer TonB [Anaeromyxobacteraceae bacterium]